MVPMVELGSVDPGGKGNIQTGKLLIYHQPGIREFPEVWSDAIESALFKQQHLARDYFLLSDQLIYIVS